MKKIYDSKPENKSGILLLFWAVLVLGITGYAGALFIFDATDVYDFIVIFCIILLILIWVAFILDEALWQLRGSEVATYDDNKIIIIRKRLFAQKYILYWDNIKKVDVNHSPRALQIINYLSIAGSQEYHFIIHTVDKKIKCGANLSATQISRFLSIADYYIHK